MYKGRGMIAPDCVYHELAQEIADALVAARREGMEEAARIATKRATDIRGLITKYKYDEETVYGLTACADELDIIAAAINHAAEENRT
jgi:hypothetical protein